MERTMLFFTLEDLPDELFLIVFSYLTKYHLFQSFLQLNQRITGLLTKYTRHLYFSSSSLSNAQSGQLIEDYLPSFHSNIHSLTFDNHQIGKDFLGKTVSLSLENLSRIKLIDNGLDLQEDFFQRFHPDLIQLVVTSFHSPVPCSTLKRIDLDFQIEQNAKDYFSEKFSSSIIVGLRLVFSKLSDYFRFFDERFNRIQLEKLQVSIGSIDQSPSLVYLPYLTDIQLEIIDPIPFDSLASLLPTNDQKLQRFTFSGRTDTIDVYRWKDFLQNYSSIKQFHLHLFHHEKIPRTQIEEWTREFPKHSIEYHPSNHSLRITSFPMKITPIDRICLNESVSNLTHVSYADEISHLILRSEYWCSSFNLSSTILDDLCKRFRRIKRLSTTARQLESFLSTNFLGQIEQLDLEFSEKYCELPNTLAEQFFRLKSISFSSMYDGTHDVSLHTVVRKILFEQFSDILFLSIDAIRIRDEEQVERSILDWYSSRSHPPVIHYTEGKSLSIWF